MTTLNTTDDLLRAARANREFREAFRREILTEELMAAPTDIKELKEIAVNIAATGEALNEHAATTNQQLEIMADGINALVQGIADYKTATEKQFTQVRTSITGVEGMLREQEQSQSSFRGTYAQSAANSDDLEIAVKFAFLHGLNENRTKTRHVRRSVLEQWVDDHVDILLSLDLKQEGALRKFQRPDIIAGAFDSPGNAESPDYYIAVEASYSAEEKDIDKATDNAKILQAITGRKAYPVVAAVRLHRRMDDDDETRSRLYEDVNEFISSSDPDSAFWHKLDSSDLRPVEPR